MKSNIFTTSLKKKLPTYYPHECPREHGFEESTAVWNLAHFGAGQTSRIWGKPVGASDEAAEPESRATDLQQTRSSYSFPDQMETIKSEARQPSLYQFFPLSTHKLQKMAGTLLSSGQNTCNEFLLA